MIGYEVSNSPTWNTDGTVNRTYIVIDVEDDAQAIAWAAAVSDPSYHGLLRQGNPQVTTVGHTLHEIVFTYKPPSLGILQPPENEPLVGFSEFDTSGGTQHITQAPYGQTWWPAEAPNLGTTIGYTEDGPEGVDIIVPKLSIQVTMRWHLFAVTDTYVQGLAVLTGAQNLTPYRGYAQGELLFTGARGTSNGLEYWEITYNFEAQANRANIPWALSQVEPPVGKGPIPFKHGHNYMWFLTRKVASENQVVEFVKAAYVAQVYPAYHFPTFLGF